MITKIVQNKLHTQNVFKSRKQCKCQCVHKEIKPSYKTVKTAVIKSELRHAITLAQNICALNGNTIECVVAWDTVSDISTAFYANKEKENDYILDPLAGFCDENPDFEECRVYEM